MFCFQDLINVAPLCQDGMVIKPSWLAPETRLTIPLMADFMDTRPGGRRFFLNALIRVGLHVGVHGTVRDDDDFINDLRYVKQRHPELTRNLHIATDGAQADGLAGLDLPDALVVMTGDTQTAGHPIVVRPWAVHHSPTYLFWGGGTFHVTSALPISASILMSHDGMLVGAPPTYSPATGWAGGIIDL